MNPKIISDEEEDIIEVSKVRVDRANQDIKRAPLFSHHI